MRQRSRKLIGATVLVALIPVYTLLVAAIAGQTVTRLPIAAQTVFFAITGLAWVLPAGALVWWMLRPDDTRPR